MHTTNAQIIFYSVAPSAAKYESPTELADSSRFQFDLAASSKIFVNLCINMAALVIDIVDADNTQNIIRAAE